MKNIFHRLVSYVVIFSLAGLPFTAQAGLIGTDDVVAQNQVQTDRAKVRDFVSRADVQQQLQQFGLTQQNAKDRVDALSEAEVQHIAGKIDALPAGGTAGTAAVVGLTVLLILIVYAIVQLFYPQK